MPAALVVELRCSAAVTRAVPLPEALAGSVLLPLGYPDASRTSVHEHLLQLHTVLPRCFSSCRRSPRLLLCLHSR
jgi:hypothetical protein